MYALVAIALLFSGNALANGYGYTQPSYGAPQNYGGSRPQYGSPQYNTGYSGHTSTYNNGYSNPNHYPGQYAHQNTYNQGYGRASCPSKSSRKRAEDIIETRCRQRGGDKKGCDRFADNQEDNCTQTMKQELANLCRQTYRGHDSNMRCSSQGMLCKCPKGTKGFF